MSSIRSASSSTKNPVLSSLRDLRVKWSITRPGVPIKSLGFFDNAVNWGPMGAPPINKTDPPK